MPKAEGQRPFHAVWRGGDGGILADFQHPGRFVFLYVVGKPEGF
jgi:hypothetical protein